MTTAEAESASGGDDNDDDAADVAELTTRYSSSSSASSARRPFFASSNAADNEAAAEKLAHMQLHGKLQTAKLRSRADKLAQNMTAEERAQVSESKKKNVLCL